MFKYLLIISLVYPTVLYNTSSADNIYRWFDKDGKIHFSDKPVSGINSSKFDKPKVQNLSMTKVTPPKVSKSLKVKRGNNQNKAVKNQCEQIKKSISIIDKKLDQRLIASKLDSYNYQLKKLRWKKIKLC